jgi:hypothetical protein
MLIESILNKGVPRGIQWDLGLFQGEGIATWNLTNGIPNMRD